MAPDEFLDIGARWLGEYFEEDSISSEIFSYLLGPEGGLEVRRLWDEAVAEALGRDVF